MATTRRGCEASAVLLPSLTLEAFFIQTANSIATPEQIENLVFANVFTMDNWYDAFMKVIHGGASPKAVLAKPEQKPEKLKAPCPKPRFEMN